MTSLSVEQALVKVFDTPRTREISHDALSDLDLIFESTVRGYREVLLTILVAKGINPSYTPTTNFYECNPRSLYEGKIRKQLSALGVPRGKSGPLNIAKAAAGLNDSWAARRKQPDVAMAVVRWAERMEESETEEWEAFAAEIGTRFKALAVAVAAMFVEATPTEQLTHLVSLSTSLMQQAAATGETAQRIVGVILEASGGNGLTVVGHLDSATATNVTSKKAGDIIVSDGVSTRVLEVTQKPFDTQRMEDSIEAIRAAATRDGGFQVGGVLVLCRDQDAPEAARSELPEGAPNTLLGTLTVDGLTFDFVELYEWVTAQLATMTPQQRRMCHAALEDYARDPDTNAAVKRVWSDFATQDEEE